MLRPTVSDLMIRSWPSEAPRVRARGTVGKPYNGLRDPLQVGAVLWGRGPGVERGTVARRRGRRGHHTTIPVWYETLVDPGGSRGIGGRMESSAGAQQACKSVPMHSRMLLYSSTNCTLRGSQAGSPKAETNDGAPETCGVHGDGAGWQVNAILNHGRMYIIRHAHRSLYHIRLSRRLHIKI